MRKLIISVSLSKLGKSEKKRIERTVQFLRTLANEFEDHGSFPTGENRADSAMSKESSPSMR